MLMLHFLLEAIQEMKRLILDQLSHNSEKAVVVEILASCQLCPG